MARPAGDALGKTVLPTNGSVEELLPWWSKLVHRMLVAEVADGVYDGSQVSNACSELETETARRCQLGQGVAAGNALTEDTCEESLSGDGGNRTSLPITQTDQWQWNCGMCSTG